MPLTLSHSEHDGYVVITVGGELDLATAPELASLADQLTPTATNVIVDATQLSFCDSSGLRVLVLLANDRQAAGGVVAIVNAQPTVRRVLEITGLTGTVVIADSVAEVTATLGS